MDFLEIPPPADLARLVQCLWELRDDTPDHAIQVVYPDGRCELLAELAVPMRFHGADGHVRSDQDLCFAGQQRGPIRLQATGPVHCVGVRLTAAGGSLIARATLPELRDTAPDLRALDADFADAFLHAARTFVHTRSAEPLWQLLRARSSDFSPDPLAESAVAALDARHGEGRIEDLARELGVGLRTLQKHFLDAVGMTPKEYARVRRLQALLRTLDTESAGIADAAARHGFSDQAHATRDLRHWTGTTPARLVRALRGNRGGDHAIRLAMAFVRGTSVR